MAGGFANGPIAYSSPVNFYIPQSVPPGLNEQTAEAIAPIYNALQQVIFTFINYCGIGPQNPSIWDQIATSASAGVTVMHGNLGRFYVIASENIAFGAMISLFKNGAVINVRNANATDNTRICDGVCSTPGGITANSAGEVFIGPCTASINGLVVGSRYYLSTADGLVTVNPPIVPGNMWQFLGVALDATTLAVNPGISLKIQTLTYTNPTDASTFTINYFGPLL